MKTKVFFMLPFVILAACQTQTTVEFKLEKPTMVTIDPDSTTIEALKQKWGEEDFYTIVDDVIWYHSELMMLVDSLDMDQISTETKNIRLVGAGNRWEINMDTTQQKWRYIYFDGEQFIEKDPITMKDYLLENFKGSK